MGFYYAKEGLEIMRIVAAMVIALIAAASALPARAQAGGTASCTQATHWFSRAQSASDAEDHYQAFLDFQQAVEAYGECADDTTGRVAAEAKLMKAESMVFAGVDLKLNGDDDDVPKAQALYLNGMQKIGELAKDQSIPADVRADAQQALVRLH